MPSRHHARALLMGTAAACALLAAPVFASSQTSGVQHFNIPSQDAATALNEYARQAGVQIVFPYDYVRGRQAPSVEGDLTRQQALTQLASALGLTVTSDRAGMVTLRDPAAPQGASAGGGAEVEALIVTAQKREEDIQDVPIAISAFTQEDLTRSQIAGGPDLITQVPNMTFTKTNFSSYSIQIRGIGTQAISATTDPAVAVAFNNTPFIRNRFFEQEFYDLERVEVLRGPQGTLYGRNATGGVVNIISAKPKFRYEAKLSADLGNFSSSRLEGMVNIPLVEDKAALRAAGAWTKRDGYAENQLTGNSIDGRDLWSTRISLRVQPTDRINVNLIWEHFQEADDRLRSGKQLCDKDVVTQVGQFPVNYFDALPQDGGFGGEVWAGVQATFSQGCKRNSLYDVASFQTPNGLMLPYYGPLSALGLPTNRLDPYVSTVQSQNLRVIESAIDPKYRARSDLGELQASFDLGGSLTLTSETAYSVDSVYSLQDFNRFNTAPGAWSNPSDNAYFRPGALAVGPDGGIFCDPQLGCSDRLVATDVSTAKSRQLSQEFRLASDFSGPFNFSLGANFLRSDSEDKYYIFINSLSLIAAQSSSYIPLGPYVGGVTDNTECLQTGFLPGDPNSAYFVAGCIYMDPNPIGSVNDQGHNYFLSRNPYKLISYAVFGEAYYRITDDLKLTAGLRWTVDKKDAPRIPTWVLASQSVGYPVAEVIEQEWREPTGRLALDWKPELPFTDETLVYASFAHGYKAGGANPPGYVSTFYSNPGLAQTISDNSATRPRIFEPEFVNAFEVGTKNTVLGGTATLNLAGFYYDYTGYQISEIVDRAAFNRNFDATVWGVELESDWRPLENLRFGAKLGYEKTRIADGEQAVDLMDRTAGHSDWLVVRPFPTIPSSCVLPAYIFTWTGALYGPGGVAGGSPSACEEAYVLNLDPVTNMTYVADPTVRDIGFVGSPNPDFRPISGYEGWNPATAPNNGEGFYKQLGGNELPNAPHFTATVTGDYTLPLVHDWLMTLHTDVHWQSQSWWRVFNDDTYDKLHPYFTMNLAAIFTNEDAGWNVMAYIKNVTDETAITGAFLNSDDTGLTTNVFLTEPRLYGLRVTKQWTGGSIPGFSASDGGPYPFKVELGAQAQRYDAPTVPLMPAAANAFQGPLAIFPHAQNSDLDWGNGGSVKLTWRPADSRWSTSAGIRYGKVNGSQRQAAEQSTPTVCIFGGSFASACSKYDSDFFGPGTRMSKTNRADALVYDREDHQIVDFDIGREFSVGSIESSGLFGLRYADLTSVTEAQLYGIPDWDLPAGFLSDFSQVEGGPFNHHTLFKIAANAERQFKGMGPIVSWDASLPLLGRADAAHVALDWSISGGVLFGDQKAVVSTSGTTGDVFATGWQLAFANAGIIPPGTTTTDLPALTTVRSEHASVPTASGALGLSYQVKGFTVGAGYRWERYFDALDVGDAERKTADRTIDGPYFKIAVGFGG